MSIPPEPIVRGAQRWLELIPTTGVKRARALLTMSREFSDLTPTQYSESLDWIQKAGLLEAGRAISAPDRLLEAVIVHSSPTWLLDADVLVRDVTELPEDVLLIGGGLGIQPAGILSCVRRAWGKVDSEIRRRIGDRGEEQILSLLNVIPEACVDHIASWSDAHGYDIAVLGEFFQCHLEVKATTRENRLSLHLSRNEYETMKTDESWHLVIAVLNNKLELARVYSVDNEWIRNSAPADTQQRARWDSARFDVPLSVCAPGIPAVIPFLRDPVSPLLRGRE